jgi:protein-S-isoprenylcysteine O-methyltransferase Ste14
MTLRDKLIRRCIGAIVVAAAMLFFPAGTIRWWEGWVYLGIITIPMVAFSAYYYKRDPALVERRMRSKEPVKRQRVIMAVGNGITATALLLPGLDHRFGWSKSIFGGVPVWLEVLALLLTLAAYLMTMYVMHVNRFAGRTVQVEPEQTVVSSGPYRFVRHPMYANASLMILCGPLGLGSYVAIPFCALFIPILIVRLLNEEKVLGQGLPGYVEYCRRTKYRLIPYIW